MAAYCGSVPDVMLERKDLPDIREFARFAVVGGVQNGLNLAAFALALAGGVPYILASVLAALVALSVSFALNLRWTFPGRTGQTMRRAIRYVAIWITMVALGLPLLAILVKVAHCPRVLAQAVMIVIVAPVSYGAQRRWTFGGGHSRSGEH
jgi:putative flippase GtrA